MLILVDNDFFFSFKLSDPSANDEEEQEAGMVIVFIHFALFFIPDPKQLHSHFTFGFLFNKTTRVRNIVLLGFS